MHNIISIAFPRTHNTIAGSIHYYCNGLQFEVMTAITKYCIKAVVRLTRWKIPYNRALFESDC